MTFLTTALLGAGLTACSSAPARPGHPAPSPVASSLLSLSCSDSAGQQGQDLEEHQEREALLNRYGRDGWELVAVSSQSYRRDYDPTALQGYTTYSYFFKKPMPDGK